jgi:hypothetical protein
MNILLSRSAVLRLPSRNPYVLRSSASSRSSSQWKCSHRKWIIRNWFDLSSAKSVQDITKRRANDPEMRLQSLSLTKRNWPDITKIVRFFQQMNVKLNQPF